MIYLFLKQEVSSTDVIVRGIHNAPFDSGDGMGKTQTELEETGYLVESIPEPLNTKGMRPVLHINPVNKNLWYTYEEADVSREEQVILLQERLQATEDMLLFLMG